MKPSGLLEIHQINVQQGGSTLIIGPDGTRVLMDGGNNGDGSTIVSYMQSLGITTSFSHQADRDPLGPRNQSRSLRSVS